MKKGFILPVLLGFSLFVLSSCDNEASTTTTIEEISKTIKTVEKTNSTGNIDTYTITFNDNSTTTFTITNDGIIKDDTEVKTIDVFDKEDSIICKIILTNGYETSYTIPSNRYIDKETYVEENLNIYRNKDVVDKTFPVRFYKEAPNVPYVDINSYYKEFFGKEYSFVKDDYIYSYYSGDNHIAFDIKNDIFYASGIDAFSENSALITSSSKTYSFTESYKSSPKSERVVDLTTYNIDVHGDETAYVPLTFLSSFSGSGQLYNISYNTKDIYVIDYNNYLNNEVAHTHEYYGDSYTAPIYDTTTERPKDLITYNYGQLCFDFDILRGYTSQLLLGDNNLVTLGLNGALDTYYPEIKELLLSENKEDYFQGYILLFMTLYDGGHTSAPMVPRKLDTNNLDQKYKNLIQEYVKRVEIKDIGRKALAAKQELGFNFNDKGYYYRYDESTKTAMIGFDSFDVDYSAWDEFYKQGKDDGEAPVDTDTYAFVRKCFYQAKEDGAKNLVFDLSSNRGGQVLAVIGIYSLINKSKCMYCANNTFDKTRDIFNMNIDINLDGIYDEKDVKETEKFDFNYAVLTTSYAFSSGNLLPSMLKEIGVKVIGQRSGGGSCSVSLSSTADGIIFARSNYHNLSNSAGDNIDSGVPLDYEINLGDLDFTKLYYFNFEEYFESLKEE